MANSIKMTSNQKPHLAQRINAPELKAVVSGTILIVVAVIRAFSPNRVLLDWPVLVALCAGIALLFLPQIIYALPFIKKVRWGDKEIEIQARVEVLSEGVEKLKQEPPSKLSNQGEGELELRERLLEDKIESKILELSKYDKESALLRLAIEIEKELLILCRAMDVEPERRTWRALVTELLKKDVLSKPMADAILEFRDVRNSVIHSGFGGPILEDSLTRTIENGLALLRSIRLTPR